MKVAMFQQAPYRFLPEDFEQHYASCVTTPYPELADAEGITTTIHGMLDELVLGARSGFDGVVVTEHGQAAYDITPNPSLPAAILGHTLRTEGLDAALIVLGRSLGKTREPLKIAEEYAMLDVISGGRLVAGFPVGLSYDANINQGIPGVETRGRFKEGYEVLRRAWASQEPFAFNGRYSQYANVNMWPRPVQDPHPPLWFPGSGNPGTMDFVLDQDAAFVLLTWFGVKMGGEGIFERFWEMCEAKGKEVNPHRVAVVQVCAVAETDERAEAEYGPWLEKGFRHGLGSIPPHFLLQPGYVPYKGLQGMLRSTADPGIVARLNSVTFRELADAGCVIVGSPATVRERLEAVCREMKVGQPPRDAAHGGDAARAGGEVDPHVLRGGPPARAGHVGARRLRAPLVAHRRRRRRPWRDGDRRGGARGDRPRRQRPGRHARAGARQRTPARLPAPGGRLRVGSVPRAARHRAGRSTRRSSPARPPRTRTRSTRSATSGSSCSSSRRRSPRSALLGADLVGSSFGGMLACELQATFPGMFGKLVVLDPIGLWRDDAPGRELAHGRPAGPARRCCSPTRRRPVPRRCSPSPRTTRRWRMRSPR